MTDVDHRTGWRGFWERGGFSRALLLVLGYLALYLLAGTLIGLAQGDQAEAVDLLGSASSVFVGLALAVIVGSVILVLFAQSLGWLRELFARQPIGGPWWMWIPPVVVLVYNILSFAAADYASFTAGAVVMILIAGLFVGFAEETLTRGFAVNLLRKGGHRELTVALLSSLLFAASHLVNALSQSSQTVLVTVVYTFAFGVTMYFTLRVTGNLIWPILLHATTDPSKILLTGGIDKTGEASAESGLATFASTANLVVIFLGFVLVWFVRGQVADRRAR